MNLDPKNKNRKNTPPPRALRLMRGPPDMDKKYYVFCPLCATLAPFTFLRYPLFPVHSTFSRKICPCLTALIPLYVARCFALGAKKQARFIQQTCIACYTAIQSEILARFDVCCFHPFLALCRLILHLLAVLQRPEAFGCDVGVMHEQVIAAFIGSNESKTLLLVKPLHCTNTHVTLLGPCDPLCLIPLNLY